jgi:coenzyme F420-reducing hydrogenase gamma subunit
MKKPRIGVFKFTSCDGCQLSLLNMEDDLLGLVELFDVAYFREATDKPLKGTFDLALVEGSISTERQREEIVDVRDRSRVLITIGACAVSGGLQALRNWASLSSYTHLVYPKPEDVRALSTSTPISDHVYVDFELWGCPISMSALAETLTAFLLGRRPGIRGYSLCMECKRRGIPCLLVSRGEPCLGPITRAGCEALCPSYGRPCYGCFGPKDDANVESLMRHFQTMGLAAKECLALLDKMNSYTYRKAHLESRG